MTAALEQEKKSKLYDAAMPFAQMAIKSCFLMNGGALLAMLPIMASLFELCQQVYTVYRVFFIPIGMFIAGLIFVSTCSFFGYLALKKYAENNEVRAKSNSALSMLCGLTSMGCFTMGIGWLTVYSMAALECGAK